jgi:hypothetical protein
MPTTDSLRSASATCRRFTFWCARCPTRVTVETEVPPSSSYPDPEYSFASSEGVAACRVHPAVPGDDGLVTADLCPACGSQLHDLDELVALGEVPPNTFTAEAHAAWRGKVAGDGQ